MDKTKCWINFAVTLLLGWLGIHKFIERKPGMGILYLFTGGLFGIGWLVDSIVYLIAAIKGTPVPKKGQTRTPPRQLLDTDPLPVVFGSNLLLRDGDQCHYSAPATYVKTKNVVVGYSGGHSGVSLRLAKGVSYRVGSSKAAPIRGNVEERTNGTLSITNNRIVFNAAKGAFDKQIDKLSALNPYSNAIEFQFGSQQYMLETHEAEYITQILVRIINMAPAN